MTLARDLAILVARIGIGAVFIAHGWQKLVTNGVDGTAAFFGSVGIPLPAAAAWFAALVEVGGGVDVDVAVADTRLDDRHRGLLHHRADQSRPAARDQHVDLAAGAEQPLDRLVAVPRDQLHDVLGQP